MTRNRRAPKNTFLTDRGQVATCLALALILVAGAYLRFSHADWDAYQHLHPDERYITWVATSIDLPRDWRDAFDLSRTSLDPFRWPPQVQTEGIAVEAAGVRAFTYGHLPLYALTAAEKALAALGRLWTPPAGWIWVSELVNAPDRIEYHHLLVVGRALSALYDTMTIGFTFLLARRLFAAGAGRGAVAGLLAAGLVTFAALHIQLAHFAAFDPAMAMFVTAALWQMTPTAGHTFSARLNWLPASVLIGFAVGSKFSAILLVIPLSLAHLLPKVTLPRLGRLALSLLIAFAAFALTNPYALLDFGRISVRLFPYALTVTYGGFAYDLVIQSGMVRGLYDFPFARQYWGTPAYWYYVEQQGRWALGWPMTLLLYAGLLWALARLVSVFNGFLSRLAARLDGNPGARGLLICLAWAAPYFAVTGGFVVKFPRYMLPLIPTLAALAGGGIAALAARSRLLAASLTAAVVIPSILYTLAFMNMYAAPHPWLVASEWIIENVPAGARVVTERFDDRLPLPGVSGLAGRRNLYTAVTLDPWAEPDDDAKLRALLGELARADYLFISSNRNYGVVRQVAARFPLATAYYRALFAEQLGFQLIYTAGRHPALAGVALRDDPVAQAGLPRPALLERLPSRAIYFGPIDESLTVYDHPRVLIFAKAESLSVDQMQSAVESFR